jgi:hypothetical protein
MTGHSSLEKMKKKLIKFIFITISTLFLLGLIAIGILYILIFRPYVKVEEVRVPKMETIHAQWVSWACGDPTSRITELYGPGADTKFAEGPLHIAVPQGGQNPEESDAAYPENRFVLTGYRYKWIETNYLLMSQKYRRHLDA